MNNQNLIRWLFRLQSATERAKVERAGQTPSERITERASTSVDSPVCLSDPIPVSLSLPLSVCPHLGTVSLSLDSLFCCTAIVTPSSQQREIVITTTRDWTSYSENHCDKFLLPSQDFAASTPVLTLPDSENDPTVKCYWAASEYVLFNDHRIRFPLVQQTPDQKILVGLPFTLEPNHRNNESKTTIPVCLATASAACIPMHTLPDSKKRPLSKLSRPKSHTACLPVYFLPLNYKKRSNPFLIFYKT